MYYPDTRASSELAHADEGQEVGGDFDGEADAVAGEEHAEMEELDRVHVHESLADIDDEGGAGLEGGGVGVCTEHGRARGRGEEVLAVDGVPIVLLVPLDEVEALALHLTPRFELQEAEQEVGHVDVEDTRVLVGAVGAGADGGVELALVPERGDAGDFEDDPGQLQVEDAGRAAHVDRGDGGGKRIWVSKVDKGQAHVQVVGHVRGHVI